MARGERPEGVFAVVHGSLKTRLQSANGDEVILSLLESGATVGVATSVLEHPSRVDLIALEESRQRLMREGRIGARLQHPHVISMFDVVVHEDRPWLVMEYLPSRSLAAVLTEATAPPAPALHGNGAR